MSAPDAGRPDATRLAREVAGVADVLLADAAFFARVRQAQPEAARELTALAGEAVGVRLAWVAATQDVVDAHAGVRQGPGIAAW